MNDHECVFSWEVSGPPQHDWFSPFGDPPDDARCVTCGISYAAFCQPQHHPDNPPPGAAPPIPAVIQAAFDEAVARSEWRFRL